MVTVNTKKATHLRLLILVRCVKRGASVTRLVSRPWLCFNPSTRAETGAALDLGWPPPQLLFVPDELSLASQMPQFFVIPVNTRRNGVTIYSDSDAIN